MNELARPKASAPAKWLRVVRALALSATTVGCASSSAATQSAQSSRGDTASAPSAAATDGAACESIGERSSRFEGPHTIACECLAAEGARRWTCTTLLTQAPGPLFPPDLEVA